MEKQNELLRITSEYFENTIDYQKLMETSRAYKSFLNNLVGREMDTENGRIDVHFNNGKALGTFWAAMCIDDIIRTRQFIRGTNRAIHEKLKDKESIHVFYAGTGPFATLLLPILLRYPSHKIKYTFLEINPVTFEFLKKVISELNLENYAITVLMEDASKYGFTDSIPDIIVSETMQNALAKEQQVPIFINLMQQANAETIFIPEKIKIYLGLKEAGISTENLTREHYNKEKKVFELSREAIFSKQGFTYKSNREIEFPQCKTTIAEEKFEKYDQLVLLTEIQVYNDEKIRINQSGLTTPIVLHNLPEKQNRSLTIRTQYKIENEPKLHFEIAENTPS